MPHPPDTQRDADLLRRRRAEEVQCRIPHAAACGWQAAHDRAGQADQSDAEVLRGQALKHPPGQPANPPRTPARTNEQIRKGNQRRNNKKS